MAAGRKIVIFCSSAKEIEPSYNSAAADFVRKACAKGYSIVSGGTVKGTMGVISEAVEACGGRHVGVIPRFMEEHVFPRLSEVIWTDTMSERKERMREGTCAAVALPGGIGTMDELVETLTLAKLYRYSGQVFALNLGGFYDSFAGLLDFFVHTGMLDEKSRGLIAFPTSVDELVEMLG